MIPKEFFQHIHRLDITTRRLVTDLFAGEYESVFKGRGIEFSEVREYQIGDDIRTIDWNVTARMNRAYTKRFVEERELSVMFLVDISGSGTFGSGDKTKRAFAAEVTALLAYAAFTNQDKVGLLLFTETVEKFLPPQKGRIHLLEMLRDLLYFQTRRRGTDIRAALKFLNRVIPRRCVVFLVSDFLSEHYWKLLRITHKRHDTIGVVIQDPREERLPAVGLLALEDAETGAVQTVNTSQGGFSAAFERSRKAQTARLFENFRAIGMDAISVTVGKPYVQSLITFFRARQRRQSLHAA